jgi:hypothetical protein
VSDERDRLERLASFLPAFESGFVFGTWRGGTAGADDVIQMPWFDFSEPAREFLRAIGEAGWIRPFDWPTWAATPEGAALVRDPQAIAGASPSDLERALTALVRGDRFHEGTLAAAYHSGVLEAIVRRAGALVADQGAGRAVTGAADGDRPGPPPMDG